jgi:hypothetical protein
MIVFFAVLAAVTAGGVWATESIDRPRRRKLREAAADAR